MPLSVQLWQGESENNSINSWLFSLRWEDCLGSPKKFSTRRHVPTQVTHPPSRWGDCIQNNQIQD
jgi:hypothetical protein